MASYNHYELDSRVFFCFVLFLDSSFDVIITDSDVTWP